MEIINNKLENPLKHYRELFAAADPQALAARSSIPCTNGVFTIPFMNRTVRLKWPEMTGIYEDGSEVCGTNLILLARLVMNGVLAPNTGKMLSYPEMPWGPTYTAQFRGRCLNRLARTYGSSLEGFAAAAASIGAKPAEGGDAAYDLEFVPGLIIRMILWAGDEEFGPSAQVLFSENFQFAFSAEDIAVIGDIFLNAMKGRW